MLASKKICLSLVVLALAVANTQAQRYIDVKIKIVTPKDNQIIYAPGTINTKIRLYNNGFGDTILVGDTFYFSVSRFLNKSNVGYTKGYFMPITKNMVMGDSMDFTTILPLKDTVTNIFYYFSVDGLLINRKKKDIDPEFSFDMSNNSNSYSLQVIYDPKNSVSSLFTHGLALYPTPTQGVLNIKVPQPLIGSHSTYTVYNMQGKVVHTYTPLINSNIIETLNLEALANGHYVVVLNSNGTRYSQVFTVQR